MVARQIDDKTSDTLVVGLRLMVLDEEFDSPPSPPTFLSTSSLLERGRQQAVIAQAVADDVRRDRVQIGRRQQVVDTDDPERQALELLRPPGQTRTDTRVQVRIP